jgi:hypothetical protein
MCEMIVYNSQNRPKFVVPTDRVIGIVIDGKAHAWPLSLMNAHEVVNDTVAGRSVLATYSPLCDTAMVFDRTVAGSVRQFEVSGLLYDSNLAFSEKLAPAAPAAPSLFSQLEARAIAGPLAKDGVTLSPLPTGLALARGHVNGHCDKRSQRWRLALSDPDGLCQRVCAAKRQPWRQQQRRNHCLFSSQSIWHAHAVHLGLGHCQR